jgi:hypothetical protein
MSSTKKDSEHLNLIAAVEHCYIVLVSVLLYCAIQCGNQNMTADILSCRIANIRDNTMRSGV